MLLLSLSIPYYGTQQAAADAKPVRSSSCSASASSSLHSASQLHHEALWQGLLAATLLQCCVVSITSSTRSSPSQVTCRLFNAGKDILPLCNPVAAPVLASCSTRQGALLALHAACSCSGQHSTVGDMQVQRCAQEGPAAGDSGC